MSLKNIPNLTVIAIILCACASPDRSTIDTDNNPVNLIPMYGYPNIDKTEDQKKADKRFIDTVSGDSGSRRKAGREFAARGWYYLQKGNKATSMRRFNQSWLLDPDYYMPYWGFGVLLNTEGKAVEALPHFDKALSLIDDDSDKPRLLADAAKAYAAQGHNIETTDKVKSEEFFNKANSLVNEALILDPQFGNKALKADRQVREAYRFGALIYYDQGNYIKAWDVVKRTRDSGGHIDPEFIKKLSGKMPEPK
jgi:tetratricopeptide (TPR) repeat protein